MDANKLKKLREIDYKINPTCGTCVHSYITCETDWGTCKLHSYSHAKHTVKGRSLSIHRSGSCEDFEISSEKEHNMSHFQEFIK